MPVHASYEQPAKSVPIRRPFNTRFFVFLFCFFFLRAFVGTVPRYWVVFWLLVLCNAYQPSPRADLNLALTRSCARITRLAVGDTVSPSKAWYGWRIISFICSSTRMNFVMAYGAPWHSLIVDSTAWVMQSGTHVPPPPPPRPVHGLIVPFSSSNHETKANIRMRY